MAAPGMERAAAWAAPRRGAGPAQVRTSPALRTRKSARTMWDGEMWDGPTIPHHSIIPSFSTRLSRFVCFADLRRFLKARAVEEDAIFPVARFLFADVFERVAQRLDR